MQNIFPIFVYMEIREKMAFLASIKTARDFRKLCRKSKGYEFDLGTGTCHEIVNLRRLIQQRLNEEGLSRNEVAKCIGIRASSFDDYFARRRNLPYKYVERILALLCFIKSENRGTNLPVLGNSEPSNCPIE